MSQQPIGETQPHPYAGCVLVSATGAPLAEAAHRAQGTEAAEVLAARTAGGAAAGGTAYLNLECGDCHGERAAVDALVHAGVARVVVGLRHPLPHLRGAAVAQLRAAGLRVDVLGEAPCSAPAAAADAALDACLAANEALLHRAVLRRPLGLLKYAMTLDGKIATHTGHSAWVSSPQSRQRVFEARAASDAVIVGGCTGARWREGGRGARWRGGCGGRGRGGLRTAAAASAAARANSSVLPAAVRRDNPRLTTRREGGHQPARIVMSRTLDLPEVRAACRLLGCRLLVHHSTRCLLPLNVARSRAAPAAAPRPQPLWLGLPLAPRRRRTCGTWAARPPSWPPSAARASTSSSACARGAWRCWSLTF